MGRVHAISMLIVVLKQYIAGVKSGTFPVAFVKAQTVDDDDDVKPK